MAPIQLEKKLDGTRVRLLRCGYQHACGCPYLAKEVELINGEHCFFSGTVPHSRHNVLLDRMTGVPPQIKAVIDSPTVLRLLPNQFLHRVTEKTSFFMDKGLRKKVSRWYAKQRTEAGTLHLTLSHPGTFGSLRETYEEKRRCRIPEYKFTENTCFLVGDKYIVDSENQRQCGVLSTENLLLNAYRQSCLGMDMFFNIDCSYRYTTAGYGLMIVQVCDPNQHGHIVAYAYVSNKDQAMHTFVFKMIKDELESIIQKKRDLGKLDV